MRRLLIALVTGGVLAAVILAQQPAPAPHLPGQNADPPAAAEYDRKLIHRPTPVPDRIVLSWSGDPATTQAVTWRTDISVSDGTAIAQLALAEGGPGFDPTWGRKNFRADKITTVPARTEHLKTAINEACYHSAGFTNLRPATRYVYRVGDGQNWSEWFQFRTASDRVEPFGFIYFGDAQNGLKTLWSRVARGAYSDMPKARFILHAGDLVNSGVSDSDWGEWHTAAGWINGMVPNVPIPGNHEYIGKNGLTDHWRPQFTLPENGPRGLEESCYHFDFQGLRVVCLNSNERIPEQAAWLRGILTKANNPNRWTVVAFHHPLYSTARGRDNKSLRDAWRPILDEFSVDLVLQGHDHTYGRSGLMHEDNLVTGSSLRNESGTVYVVSVSGAKMYTLGEQEWMQSSAENTQLYQLIRIDGDVLKYESRTATGDLFDSFELHKKPNGRNELVETLAAKGNPSRVYWNAAGGALVGSTVLLGLMWAFRRKREAGSAATERSRHTA